MPSKTIQSKEASHTITKALDLSKDRLVTQIKKTMETRKHSSIKRKPAKVEEIAEELLESLEMV